MRAFSNGPNNMKFSSDHINKKRAETTYYVASNDINKTQLYNNNSNIPVKACQGQLSSVGGYNIKSYDLLLDLTKGKYYNATSGRIITLLSDSSDTNKHTEVKINDCSGTYIKTVDFSKLSAPISQTWGINEGPFLLDISKSLSNSCDCNRELISKDPYIIINNSLIYQNSGRQLARWNNENPLRGFTFPKTICFT
jgi:hypothetical protein